MLPFPHTSGSKDGPEAVAAANIIKFINKDTRNVFIIALKRVQLSEQTAPVHHKIITEYKHTNLFANDKFQNNRFGFPFFHSNFAIEFLASLLLSKQDEALKRWIFQERG
jgi:hypothetical protein